MKDRLNQFLQLEQLSSARFAAILGIQPSSVSHILSGRNKPGFDFIEKMLLKFPGLNVEWLITGKGKMFKDPQPSVKPLVADLFGTPPVPYTQSPLPSPETISEPQAPAPQAEISNPLSIEIPNTGPTGYIEKIVLFYSDKHFEEFFPR
jgi:Bacteriophage CI repressor helix-turn-helix domain.